MPYVPRVSFIVPLHNRLDLTRAFIASLEGTVGHGDWECILVDDVSVDGTRDYIATLPERYRVFLNESRRGYAANINLGARAARARTFVLLNNDLVLTAGWLEPMVELAASESGVGAVGNIQVQPATGLVDHAGIVFHRDGSTFHAHKNRKAIPHGEFSERHAASAACLLVPRAVFEAVGGMDEEYVNGSEDVDFCIRVVLAGHRILVSHRSLVYHHVSSSPGRMTHVDRNLELLESRWGETMRRWGEAEWAPEYLRRYARQPWRANPRMLIQAIVGTLTGA